MPDLNRARLPQGVEHEFPAGADIKASCFGYLDYVGKLDKGTEGDFVETTIILSDELENRKRMASPRPTRP
jgi:hypothetical protein